MLLRKLLKVKLAEAEHDLLQKAAYSAVRMARANAAEAVIERGIERLKGKFPEANRDDIEEAVKAMAYNMNLERGEM